MAARRLGGIVHETATQTIVAGVSVAALVRVLLKRAHPGGAPGPEQGPPPRRPRYAGAAVLAGSMSLWGPLASAQTVANADDSGGLAEIVVTAQKRASTVQETPISITAVSGTDLQDRGIADVATLAAATPGVSLKSNGPGQTEIEMRGMTSSGGNSATVGFYLDDVPMTAPAGAQNGKVVIDPTLYDLNRVEVLRGPQGTLYGSGSMGGTVKLVTNQPNLTQTQGSFESILSGTDGGGFNHNDNFMLNLPLINDQLALRIVGSEAHTSGWIDRIVLNPFPLPTNGGATRGAVLAAPVESVRHGSNAEQLYGVRVTMLWKPTDALSITPSVFYQRITQEGPSSFDSVPGTEAHYQPFGVAEPYSDEIKVYSLTVNYNFDSFDITSITAQWNRNSIQSQDGSENFNNPLSGVEINAPGTLSYYLPGGTGPVQGTETDPSKQFSEEIRAASTGDGPLRWVGGLFYSHFQSVWNLYTAVQNPSAYVDLGTFGPATANAIWNLTNPTKISQYAAFGEGTYALTSHLKATVGLRWYAYDYSFYDHFAGFGSPLGGATPSVDSVSQNHEGVNPKFNLSYEFDKDLMVYVTASKGYRPGGANQPLPTTGPLWAPGGVPLSVSPFKYPNGQWPKSYDPDTLWSYELGEKARFLDRRLTVNASVYYENWSNVQLLELPNDYLLNDNNGNARIFGGELEARALLGAGFELGISGGYTHATLSPGDHYTITPSDVLPDVPKFTANVNLTYEHPLTDKYTFSARVENTFVDRRLDLTFPAGFPTGELTPLPSYDLTNLRAGIRSDSGWGLAFFVNNVFNKQAYLENMTELTLTNASFNRVVTNQPLTGGIDLTYAF
ncbi:MAG TPA: TonB-dependent receptor [Steroidobacteraceae bacterium]|nr:TonB-dependent receptor [Steroidobacteraceae bacterium]